MSVLDDQRQEVSVPVLAEGVVQKDCVVQGTRFDLHLYLGLHQGVGHGGVGHVGGTVKGGVLDHNTYRGRRGIGLELYIG